MINSLEMTPDVPRCRDKTEAGTHFSSILCPGCRTACPPLRSPTADWSWPCPRCARQTTRSQVEAMLQRLHSELECLRDKPSPVEELEVILERFQHSSPVLLPNILTLFLQVQQYFPSSPLYDDGNQNQNLQMFPQTPDGPRKHLFSC